METTKLGYNVKVDWFDNVYVEVYKLVKNVFESKFITKEFIQTLYKNKTINKPCFFFLCNEESKKRMTQNMYDEAKKWAEDHISMLIDNNTKGKYERIGTN